MAVFMHVGGRWRIKQSNGFVVEVSIDQQDDRLTGFCTHSNGGVRSTDARGFVRGDTFDFTITWDNGTKGRYVGRLERGFFTQPHEGILKGNTVDEHNRQSTATWEVPDKVFLRP